MTTYAEKRQADWLAFEAQQQEQLFANAALEWASPDPDAPAPASEPINLSEDDRELARLARDPAGPEQMLVRLRKQLDDMAQADKRRGGVQAQVDRLEEAIKEVDPGDLRPIDALYVASEGQATSIRMALQVGWQRDSSRPVGLRLIDFTLAGTPRTYTEDAWTLQEAMRDLLKTFADDSPYPDGSIRFAVHPSVLPKWMGDLKSETLTYPTDGGMVLDDVLKALSGVALVVGVGAAALGQPEIAIPAFYVSSALGGAGAAVSLYDRLAHGDFEWGLDTTMDLLDVASALVGLGSLGQARTAIQGVGQVTLAARIGKGLDVIQIGVLAGSHALTIGRAIASGDEKRVLDALVSAVGEGALFLVVHRASSRMSAGSAGGTGAGDSGGRGPQIAWLPNGPTPEPSIGGGGRGRTDPAHDPADPHRASHETWSAEAARTGLGPRPMPEAQPGAAAVPPEARFGTMDEALTAYDNALAQAGDREVGIFRHPRSGEYAVMVGDQRGVASPGKGWEGVLHRHRSADNVLTRRMPAPKDVELLSNSAIDANRPVTEFIEYDMPGGLRGRTAYTVDPVHGKITIEYQRHDGSRVRREFEDIGAYEHAYGERTTFVDPKSDEYAAMMSDLDDFYGRGGGQSGGADVRTASGTAKGKATKKQAKDAIPTGKEVDKRIGSATPEHEPRGSQQKRDPRWQIPDIAPGKGKGKALEKAHIIAANIATAWRTNVAFRTVDADPAVAGCWTKAVDHVRAGWLKNQTLTEELMLGKKGMYEQVRERFWIEVRRNGAAKRFFSNGGLVFPPGNGSPLIKGYGALPPSGARRSPREFGPHSAQGRVLAGGNRR